MSSRWSADNQTLFALTTPAGETHRFLVAINVAQRTFRKVVAADSAFDFAFTADSASLYAILQTSNPNDLMTRGSVRLTRIDVASGAKTSIASFQQQEGGFSSDGSRFVYHVLLKTNAVDSIVALDAATGTRVGAMTFPTPTVSGPSTIPTFLVSVSPEGKHALIWRAYVAQLAGQPNYPPMMFDWNVNAGTVDSTPAFDNRHDLEAAAYVGTGFRIAYADFDGTAALGPNAGFRDVSFGMNDSTSYALVSGTLPAYAAWLPSLRAAWASVVQGCYGDQKCTTVHFILFYSTPTGAVQVGSVNAAVTSFPMTGSPDGHWLVSDVTGRGLFVIHR